MSIIIKNTKVEAIMPWPVDVFIQGGASGLVVSRSGAAPYSTAFVEVFLDDTFIRGEGATIVEAEEIAWEKYQRGMACDGHEYEPRGYTNGLGFCRKCNRSESNAFSGEDLGQYCCVCGVGTTYSRYTDEAFFDVKSGFVRDKGDEANGKWYCEEHRLFKKEVEAELKKLSETPVSIEALIEVLNILGGNTEPDDARAKDELINLMISKEELKDHQVNTDGASDAK